MSPILVLIGRRFLPGPLRARNPQRVLPTPVLPLFLAIPALLLAPASPTPAADGVMTESRMPYRHVIPLRDHAGDMITPPAALDEDGKPQDPRGNPLSTAQTCGRCHDYASISQGWHFNAAHTNVAAGRPGEPWILTDPATRTQIPLSYRGWRGTFLPADVGLSDFDFLVNFARHYPGGGVGEPASERIAGTNDVRLRRMQITGALEIDCLICHAKHGHYDHEARFKAVSAENFKWAPTIASELGAYGATRPAKAFADAWRPPRPAPANLPPIKYERGRFDIANHVAIEVTRKPPPSNCYYCHTSESQLGGSRWHSDGDVHIRAGMSCVDCHRNGIDHQIVRGYEGESRDRSPSAASIDLQTQLILRDDPAISEADARRLAETQLADELGKVETLTCGGCHFGSPDGKFPGRLGAPKPHHAGFPPIHFEKLTCTACHSGPVPGDAAEIVHTSLAHKLGLPAPMRGANTAPGIVQPVFLRTSSGQIAPHKVVWPAYWGVLSNGLVRPLLPEAVAKSAGDKFPTQSTADIERDPYKTKPLSADQIREILTALGSGMSNAEPVLVASGKLHRLAENEVRSEEHEAASPYAWPVGHDVRPASQSVGAAKGCADCHSEDSPIYFGTVTARGPVDPTEAITRTHLELRSEDPAVVSTFAFTFKFRPMLKVVTFGCAIILLGAVLGRFLVVLSGARHSVGRHSK
ncbi:MAG: hypothetical protein AB7O66_23625 [Limisphaerales bacterium]